MTVKGKFGIKIFFPIHLKGAYSDILYKNKNLSWEFILKFEAVAEAKQGGFMTSNLYGSFFITVIIWKSLKKF